MANHLLVPENKLNIITLLLVIIELFFNTVFKVMSDCSANKAGLIQ